MQTSGLAHRSNSMSEVKISFTVDEKTASRIERYWHNRRFANRSDAIRVLVRQGLADLEDHNSTNPPTQKQINLVRKLCREKNLSAPEEWSSMAYSVFIGKNISKNRQKGENE